MTMDKLTSGISHVGLTVFDLDKSFAFFEALGYKKIGGNQSYPSYFISDDTTMITLWKADPAASPFDRRKNIGLHHLAIKATSLEALQNAYKKVLSVEGTVGEFAPQELQGTPLHHCMVYEPSGNRIEITYHAA